MTNDYIVKALAYGGQIRAYSALTTESVQEAQTRHYTWPTASAALGRTMTATLMMGAMLKGEQKLTVTVDGQGPIGKIIADADANGHVRGYVTNPQTHFPLNNVGKLDVGRAVGSNGALTVVKDVGLKDYFSGSSPLVSGELGDDFTYYFAKSEQTPSSVGLGVLVNPDNSIKAAGGFIIQVMPGAEEETINKLEEVINNMTPVSKLIDQGLTPEEILFEVLGEDNVQILENMLTSFECNCGHEKFLNAIKGLGQAEIESMINEDHGAEAECHFCRNKYQYSESELQELLEKMQ
ncbi:Hsp33 family molecular chaperone HslO [Staphylococcus nepalensis]|jgi:molecular chaperone Hsp33|uniref:33 kDa chaperonin n=1 Tax=Staphylococcus nepalensis TaxID=214473 RepID=A0ABS3L491_9STAP|nr:MULTISPECIES: Hsp33 family molecular chaperone HslO [Staphylococcus]MBO1214509.1 Hsp33 family molecular chaperone HslO [Staphylococcus nepalensis]MBO1217528.1 Hsp33 family molecular chaperone HslO [Staphylococcus nepalensis]MBO1228367.1 Hsp33 family molecular chaperone HslO [Staphylococcus nepalensis]MBO1236065.1 Hsp33 family molecular chaperone HslO [Staphylococcus nepalensis]MBO1237999.1 Hsp33 family molecular chaperone HslO [Staphylococcus nepalensis]